MSSNRNLLTAKTMYFVTMSGETILHELFKIKDESHETFG